MTPCLWKRFVDDILAVVQMDKSHQLLEHLNRQHLEIRLTMEKEENGVLPVMDIRFSRNERGSLRREVFQKPTHTNRYIQFSSHHPESVKAGVIECLVDRAMIVSSEKYVTKARTQPHQRHRGSEQTSWQEDHRQEDETRIKSTGGSKECHDRRRETGNCQYSVY